MYSSIEEERKKQLEEIYAQLTNPQNVHQALRRACFAGKFDLAKKLIEEFAADPNICDDGQFKRNALHQACLIKDAEIRSQMIKLLISKGAKLSIPDSDGLCAIQYLNNPEHQFELLMTYFQSSPHTSYQANPGFDASQHARPLHLLEYHLDDFCYKTVLEQLKKEHFAVALEIPHDCSIDEAIELINYQINNGPPERKKKLLRRY